MQTMSATDRELLMTCSRCLYLSNGGRCQRLKSAHYSRKIEWPENFVCARWERNPEERNTEIRKA